MSVRWHFKLQGWKEMGGHLHKERENFHWLTVLTWHRIAGECSTNWRSVLFWFLSCFVIFSSHSDFQFAYRHASISNVRVTVQQSVSRFIMIHPWAMYAFIQWILFLRSSINCYLCGVFSVFYYQEDCILGMHTLWYAYRKKNWKNGIHEL